MTGYKNILKPKSKKEIKTSMEEMDPGELLKISTRVGSFDGVKIAIERGANIHRVNDDAIREASQNGFTNIAEFLLDNNANIEAIEGDSLRVASQQGHYNIVKLLLKHGANVHVKNNDSYRYAKEGGHKNIMRLLKKYYE